jgi:hypothetical protein
LALKKHQSHHNDAEQALFGFCVSTNNFSAATFPTQTKQRATSVTADDIKQTLDPS